MTVATLLIVDDESYVRDSLRVVLERRGFEVRTAESVAAAREQLSGLDAVLVDLRMPGETGDVLVRELQERETPIPVVVLTAHGTVRSAVECMKAGAADYLLKPTDPDEIELVLQRIVERDSERRELRYLREEGPSVRDAGPIGATPPWMRVMELAETAAPTDTSVLLLGESGTGKEEVARLVHRTSPRRERAFVGVNCAAIPADLFESELFGHRRGAFTGATADREGRFRIAHRGTLFLDEIDALSSAAQAKLLRVLQEGEIHPVGDSRPTRVDVRILCAANVDLRAEVDAGRFRPDLYYRIAVLEIRLPPLRERRGDVALLAAAFLDEMNGRFGKRVRALHPETLAMLEAYPWPGNVRELRNVVERGVLLEKSESLRPESLPFSGAESARAPSEPGDDLSLRRALHETERRLLLAALERAEGVKKEASRLLGIDPRNLPYYLRKHEID